MELFKFGIKLRFTGAAHREFLPVLHGWIQRQALPGHLLIDVHDYRHVPHGPGLLLVAHEAHLHLSEADHYLMYVRKQPASLAVTRQAAQAAAQLLAKELGVQFATGTFEIFANDRRLAPNDLATAARLQTAIAQATVGAVVQQPNDSRERLTFIVTQQP